MAVDLPEVLPANRQATHGAGVHTAAHDDTETAVNVLRDAVADLDGETVRSDSSRRLHVLLPGDPDVDTSTLAVGDLVFDFRS